MAFINHAICDMDGTDAVVPANQRLPTGWKVITWEDETGMSHSKLFCDHCVAAITQAVTALNADVWAT